MLLFNMQNSKLTEVISFIRSIIVFIAIVLLLRGTVVEAFKIPSGSMKPTLQILDRILVTKFSYGLRLPFFTHTLVQYSTPKRGDVVVFTRPDDLRTPDKDESEDNIVKRTIGVAGDTVLVKDTQVFVNGELLREPYARWERGGGEEGNFGPVTVPEGHVFLLGDNRDDSKDSRFWPKCDVDGLEPGFPPCDEGNTPSPFLEVSRVKGKAIIIYWSTNDLSRIGTLIH